MKTYIHVEIERALLVLFLSFVAMINVFTASFRTP
jgi:hypothetical protein